MLVIRRSEGLWIVGYWEPETESEMSTWTPLKDYADLNDALLLVHYLHGGDANLGMIP